MSTIARPGWLMRDAIALVVAVVLTLLTTALSTALQVKLLQVSSDPFKNPQSQHKTQVEPDTFSSNATIISVFESGRFFDRGSSNIGWAASSDNGTTWTPGFFPGTTPYSTPPGIYQRVSDPSIAYDSKDGIWITSFLGLFPNGNAKEVDVLVSLSFNHGRKWTKPIPVDTSGPFFDKNWTVCDNSTTSLFYGNCYTEFDNLDLGALVLMSTSTNGGMSWEAPLSPTGNPRGLGGQPLVQPNGTVIVPIDNSNASTILSFMSANGGSSWSAAVTVARINFHTVAGRLRTSPLPSAEIDEAGTVYVAWQDCRFEAGCSANDIVYSTSSNGTTWSAVQRVPADPVGSGVDHFLPGFGVDRSTSGSSAHLGVLYYYFPNANCNNSTCQLDVGFLSSTDGGAHWSSSTQLAGPMKLTWLANAGGYMVGDYFAVSFTASGKAFSVFAVATAPIGGLLNEAMYTVKGGLPVTGGTNASADIVLSTGYAPASAYHTAY